MCGQHVNAAGAQPLHQLANLKRLARPLGALERDEQLAQSAFEIRTRRYGSLPVLREARLCCSANWCCRRRMYALCGDSSTGADVSSTCAMASSVSRSAFCAAPGTGAASRCEMCSSSCSILPDELERNTCTGTPLASASRRACGLRR